jgi:hypothetical protein
LPKCQAAAARKWLEDREAELLPVPYFHVVFTLPSAIAAIAFHNKAAVHDLLFKTAAETLTTIAAEFIRRFLMHVLPSGFHRLRHYGLFASAARAHNIERVRALLAVAETSPQTDDAADTAEAANECPCCGGRMIIIETFGAVRPARPALPCRIRIDTSSPSWRSSSLPSSARLRRRLCPGAGVLCPRPFPEPVSTPRSPLKPTCGSPEKLPRRATNRQMPAPALET